MLEFIPDPHQDGISHINVYSRAKTPLGQFLSNFTKVPIQTRDGLFQSIEGYWYWLLTDHSSRDQLRDKYGPEAKKLGRLLTNEDYPNNKDSEFFLSIKDAIKNKINNSFEFREQFKKSTLPFMHYYVMYGKVKLAPGSEWILEFLEEYRQQLKNGL